MPIRPRAAAQADLWSSGGESVIWMLALVLNALITSYTLEASKQLQAVSTCLAPYYMDAIMYQSERANGTRSGTSADEASVNEASRMVRPICCARLSTFGYETAPNL